MCDESHEKRSQFSWLSKKEPLINGSGALKRGPVHVRQGGRLRAFNSHHFVSNMFWLLDEARERARAPGEDGAEGQGFKCDKDGINKIMEVLRMERRKTYGWADNDIVGGGRQKMKVKLKGGCFWFRLLWTVGPGRRVAASVPSDGTGGGGGWNTFVRYLSAARRCQ